MKHGVDNEINERLMALYKDTGDILEYESPYYPASELVICPRRVFYRKTGEKVTDPPSLETLRLMDYGNEIHEQAYRWLDKVGLYSPLGEERKFTADLYNLVFQVDKFIWWKGEVFIVEVKSVSTWAFDGTKNYSSVREIPKDYHYYQLQIEMNVLGLRGYLFYFERGFGKEHMTPCEIDKKAFKDMTVRSAEITSAINNGEAMDRPFSCIIDKNGLPRKDQQRNNQKYKSDWQCYSGYGWCPFLSLCWKQEINPEWRRVMEK